MPLGGASQPPLSILSDIGSPGYLLGLCMAEQIPQRTESRSTAHGVLEQDLGIALLQKRILVNNHTPGYCASSSSCANDMPFGVTQLVYMDRDPTKIFFQGPTYEPITPDYTLQTVFPGNTDLHELPEVTHLVRQRADSEVLECPNSQPQHPNTPPPPRFLHPSPLGYRCLRGTPFS